MRLEDKTDEELMLLLKQSEASALVVLYERHSLKVWSYLQKRVPAGHAEDLFQDCFVKLVEKKDGWNGQPFVLWLYVLLRNTVNDYYRGKKVENKYLKLIFSENEAKDPALQVEEILISIPEDKARLLKEFFEEGWSYKELASMYQVSEVSLRKRLSRALKMLKRSHQDER